MLTLSAQAKVEKNTIADAGAWLELIELTLPGGASPSLWIVNNTEQVTFDGQVYAPFPFDREDIQDEARGAGPLLRIRVSNLDGTVQAWLEANDGCVGGGVRIMLVHSEHLDLSAAEVTLDFEILSAVADPAWVTFELGADSPAGKRFPRARLLKNFCRWKFKGTECAYAGATASCDKTLAACRALTGGSNSAKFGGFPGIGRGGLVA